MMKEEIIEFKIEEISDKGFCMFMNFAHLYKINIYIEDVGSFIKSLTKWIKEIEHNKLPSSLECFNPIHVENNEKYIFIASTSTKPENIKIEVLNNTNKVVEFTCEVRKNLWVRKLKSSVYYSFRYMYDSSNLKLKEKILTNPSFNTLKKSNDGLSTIQIVKNEKADFNILIDGTNIDTLRYIDINELKKSCNSDGEYYFYTCSCGVHECGGIWEPIVVYSKNNYIYWDMIEPYGGRFKFNKEQYINEIEKYENEKTDFKY